MVAFVVLLTPGQPGIARVSLGTAYAALLLLGISLTIGPFRVIRGRLNPPSNNVRRDVGIWAGIFGILHMAIGLQVHLRGDMLAYFFHRDPQAGSLAPRIDPFGAANDTGLIAILVLLLLLALSNNASLRALKVRRWKGLQRWNYWAALLVLIHGALYQALERRSLGFVVLFIAVAAAVAAMQAAGYVRRARAARPLPS